MRETPEDLQWLQEQLDATYARAGEHLAGIHTPAARIDAQRLADELPGMQILVVATVSSDARPFTGPVDAFFYRGRWHFGTAATALRARHLRRNPAVSATLVRGEELVVTVHGRASEIVVAEDLGFREVLVEKYGDVMEGAPYFRIDPDRLFAADMSVHTAGSQE